MQLIGADMNEILQKSQILGQILKSICAGKLATTPSLHTSQTITIVHFMNRLCDHGCNA